MAQSLASRLWRPADANAIEAELAALWRDAARDQPVARAVMSNLVVFRMRLGAKAVNFDALARELPIDEVLARHPSRLILLDYERHDVATDALPAAAVAVSSFGPAQTRYAVEEIALQSTCAARSLPSLVRHLLRGGVPTSVWWAEDASMVPPIPEIVEAARQLIYDSRQWRDVRRGVVAIARVAELYPRLDLADLNWRRVTPLRHALLHACAAAPVAGLAAADVRIAHRPGDAALAWLVAGWLAARLGWKSAAMPLVEESRRGGDVLALSIGANGGTTLRLSAQRVAVTVRGARPLTKPIARETDADAVAAELRSLARDTCLHDTIAALVQSIDALPGHRES